MAQTLAQENQPFIFCYSLVSFSIMLAQNPKFLLKPSQKKHESLLQTPENPENHSRCFSHADDMFMTFKCAGSLPRLEPSMAPPGSHLFQLVPRRWGVAQPLETAHLHGDFRPQHGDLWDGTRFKTVITRLVWL